MNRQANTKRTLAQGWRDFQPTKAALGWTAAAAIVATVVAGFSWGGWVTEGTSRTMAMDAGRAARVELASAVCVDNFNTQAGSAIRLAELKAITNSYARREYVEQGGWAIMPGATETDRRDAAACADALMAA